jgi:hypothetical protein
MIRGSPDWNDRWGGKRCPLVDFPDRSADPMPIPRIDDPN